MTGHPDIKAGADYVLAHPSRHSEAALLLARTVLALLARIDDLEAQLNERPESNTDRSMFLAQDTDAAYPPCLGEAPAGTPSV